MDSLKSSNHPELSIVLYLRQSCIAVLEKYMGEFGGKFAVPKQLGTAIVLLNRALDRKLLLCHRKVPHFNSNVCRELYHSIRRLFKSPKIRLNIFKRSTDFGCKITS